MGKSEYPPSLADLVATIEEILFSVEKLPNVIFSLDLLIIVCERRKRQLMESMEDERED